MNVGANGRTIVPSTEQQKICSSLAPPTNKQNNVDATGGGVPTGDLVHIMAAAGTGKTTTLLFLAKQAYNLGHRNIQYITFNKTAAEDTKTRIQQYIGSNELKLEATTIHACAMRLLRQGVARPDMSNDDSGTILLYIEKFCRGEIDKFMRPCIDELYRRHYSDWSYQSTKEMQAREQVKIFILKTFEQFCRSDMSLEDFGKKNTFNRVHYPAVLYHQSKKARHLGFIPEYYASRTSFYADVIYNKLWPKLVNIDAASFCLEMKNAQLLQLEIPCSLLLVDECQDMDACQVDWVSKQIHHGTHVYLVGDCAQTIYSFRGAKSTCVMKLIETNPSMQKHSLTTSWRFGSNIARIANCILFGKEYSPQTSGNKYNWDPYRVIGGGKYPGKVTHTSLLTNKEEYPVTLIAATNLSLLVAAARLIRRFSERAIQPDTPKSLHHHGHLSQPIICRPDGIRSCQNLSSNIIDSKNNNDAVPKIHINSSGVGIGHTRFLHVIQILEFICRLYQERPKALKLPRHIFHDIIGDIFNWQSFWQQVIDRDLTQYKSALKLVQEYKDETIKLLDAFQREVLEKNYTAIEADIILTTCHSAKGLEWDTVEISEDFWNINQLILQQPAFSSSFSSSQPSSQPLTPPAMFITAQDAPERSKWQFNAKEYGDDVNLLYVACTRARKKLCIPTSIWTLLQDCDVIHQSRQQQLQQQQQQEQSNMNKSDKDKSNLQSRHLFGIKRDLSEDDVMYIHEDIVMPLRKAFGVVSNSQLLMDYSQPTITTPEALKSNHDNNHTFMHRQKQRIPPPDIVTPSPKRYKISLTW